MGPGQGFPCQAPAAASEEGPVQGGGASAPSKGSASPGWGGGMPFGMVLLSVEPGGWFSPGGRVLLGC